MRFLRLLAANYESLRPGTSDWIEIIETVLQPLELRFRRLSITSTILTLYMSLADTLLATHLILRTLDPDCWDDKFFRTTLIYSRCYPWQVVSSFAENAMNVLDADDFQGLPRDALMLLTSMGCARLRTRKGGLCHAGDLRHENAALKMWIRAFCALEETFDLRDMNCPHYLPDTATALTDGNWTLDSFLDALDGNHATHMEPVLIVDCVAYFCGCRLNLSGQATSKMLEWLCQTNRRMTKDKFATYLEEGVQRWCLHCSETTWISLGYTHMLTLAAICHGLHFSILTNIPSPRAELAGVNGDTFRALILQAIALNDRATTLNLLRSLLAEEESLSTKKVQAILADAVLFRSVIAQTREQSQS